MFYCLCCTVTHNKSKGNIITGFCCFSSKKALQHQHFLLIFLRTVVFVCLNGTNDGANNLIRFLLCNHHFSTFQQVFHTLLAYFLKVDQKLVH